MAQDTTKKNEEAAPPDPRGAGSASPRPDSEDKVVAEIEAENKQDALDTIYDQESEPEAPMLVLGDEKHPRLAALKRPKFWILLFLALLVVALFAWLITPSRLWLLNTLGQRTKLNVITTVSTAEGTPPILKNATVTVNGKAYTTDDTGKLHVDLPYGPVHIVVAKQGYDTITKDQTLDFDPFFYKLGGQKADTDMRNLTFALKNVGVLVTFTAKDWLTGMPVTRGTFSVGDVAATPTADGIVTLALPATDAKTVAVKGVFVSDYANATVEVPVGAAKPDMAFVPAGNDYFISKRSGLPGVYRAGLDGSNVAEIITGSPNETGDMAFSVSPSGKYAVLASTREATRDTFGSVQQKLYLVDLASNKLTPLDTALKFHIADWAGDTVVYTAESRTVGGETVQRLGSIDTAAAKQTTLATSNGFVVVRVRLGSAVYLLNPGELRTVKVKGGTEKSLGSGIADLAQAAPDKFVFRTTADNTWHQYDINADQLTTIPTPTSNARTFLASASADGQSQALLDLVDGKPTLVAKNAGSGKETTLYAGTDLGPPIRWVGNVLVYRAGSADYAVSPLGGAPKKITDVTPMATPKNDYFNFN